MEEVDAFGVVGGAPVLFLELGIGGEGAEAGEVLPVNGGEGGQLRIGGEAMAVLNAAEDGLVEVGKGGRFAHAEALCGAVLPENFADGGGHG